MYFTVSGRGFRESKAEVAVGSVLTAPGGLQVLRASASATTELKPGDAIFLGDRLQNDGANSVWIGLNDGTAIYIGRGHRLTIDGTICDALGHLTDGALETKRPGVKIIAQIPSPSGADWTHHVARGGSGMMAIAAFTVALIEELQARNDDLTTLLDDSMSYQGLGSIYEVVTNEAVPRVLHVEPGIDLILTPRGSGLGVDLQITSAQQMLDLLNQSRDVLSMWQRGQQDAIIHKADLDNAAPTQGGTPGSGSLFPDFPPITTGPIILVNGPTSPPPPPPPPPPSPPPPPPPDPLPQQGNVPTKPVITDVSNISSPTIQDLTNDNTPTLSGAAPPGTTVTIYDNGSTVLGTAHADNTTGAWNFTVDQAHALSDGQHSFTATATDSGGHVSDPSPAVILTIDMTNPTAGTLAFTGLTDTGHTDSPPITQDGTFSLSLNGDTDANGIASVVYQQNLNGAGWTDLTGSSLSGLADGSYQFHAVVTDNAGNSSTTNTTSVIVDNTAPGLTITETDQSGGNFLFTFTFSEGVFDFVQGNHGITVTNGTASTFSGADGSSSYTLLVTPGAGTVSVSVANGAASDAAGNLSAVASYSMADPNDNDSQGLGTNDSLGSSSSHQSQVLYGGAGNDTLSGGQAADTLYGGSGNDVINGDNGGDVIYGGSGNDTINGGVGSDTIIGGYGADQLTGGQGANVFMYLSTRDSTPAQPDTIMDFDASNEKIVFYDSGFAAQGQVIDADSTLAGLQHFTTVTNTQTIQAHNINWYYDANLLQPDGVTHGETVIQADTDGNTATAEMEIHLVGQVTLTAANFVLA